MRKPERGESGVREGVKENAWRFTEEGCLRQFVTTVALNKNEYVDTSMAAWAPRIRGYLESLGN